MTGPREFWIFPGVEAWQSDEVVMNPECVKKHHIHVIEKSAYDQLLEEAKRLAEALAEMQHESSEVAESLTRWQEYLKGEK